MIAGAELSIAPFKGGFAIDAEKVTDEFFVTELRVGANPLLDLLPDLMHRYQMGDAAAANELVDQLHPILQRFFWAIAGGSTPVDDLLQECWLRIHRARHSYRQGEPVLPWVFAIARHSKVDQFRRMQRTSGRESSIDGVAQLTLLEDPRQQWDGSLTAQRIMKLVEALPPAQRDVVIMLKIAGMTLEEVAQATGSNANAVKQKAFRAYRTIRGELGVEEPKE